MAIQERVLERLLARFVDREAEMQRFRDMLTSDIKHITVVWGESGMGKSWLLQKMMHECAQRSIHKARVTWIDTSGYDYMGTMRAIRNDLIRDGLNVVEDCFRNFNKLINDYTDENYPSKVPAQVVVNLPGGQSVFEQGTIQNSSIGEIANNIIKDNNFVIPRSDLSISVKERQIRLTESFIRDLNKVVLHEHAVVFFDATEKMDPETENWVWDELLRAVFEERLCNIKFVICGQRRRELPADWNLIVDEAELRSVSKKDIIEYLTRCGVTAEKEELAKLILAATKGRIKDIAMLTENYMKLDETQGAS